MPKTAVFHPVCALCGKKFENCDFLAKHIKLKHGPISDVVSAGEASSGLSSETPLLQTPCAEPMGTQKPTGVSLKSLALGPLARLTSCPLRQRNTLALALV
jgi:hypothetical protein